MVKSIILDVSLGRALFWISSGQFRWK